MSGGISAASALYYAMRVLGVVFNVLQGIILIDCVISWIPPVRHSRVGYVFRVLADPILAPVRALLNRTPLRNFPIDFSPIGAIFLLDICYRILSSIIVRLFYMVS